MVTYNHHKWISDAIDGVLMQKTSFPIELIIADDNSTDDNLLIIEKYQSDYPDIIKVIKRSENLGLGGNFSDALNHCKGKFIAICEGDDYWTDENKLQIQYDILNDNDDLILCCHNTTKWNTDFNKIFHNYKFNENFYFDQSQFLSTWITQPLTVVFKNCIDDYSAIYRDGIFCDVILFYEVLKHGKGYFLKNDMSVFRVHKTALSSGLSDLDWNLNHIIMYDNLLKYNLNDFRLKKLIWFYHIKLLVLALNDAEISQKIGTRNIFISCIKKDYSFFNKFITVLVRFPYYYIKYKLNLINKEFSFNK
jgi:glycosyltransferase involved in cell wall biosynthesis